MESNRTPTDGPGSERTNVGIDGMPPADLGDDVQKDRDPTGIGAEAAEGINDAGVRVPGERNALDSRAIGRSFRQGAERSGSEPLVNRDWVHESGYGGEMGGPRISSDQREASERGGRQASTEAVQMAPTVKPDAEDISVHRLKRDEQVVDPTPL